MESYPGRNQPYQISSRLHQGVRELWGPKIGCFPLTFIIALTTVLRTTVLHCDQCFSTEVLRDLRVLPVASKGSVELNREMGTKWHLQPLDAFSGLVKHPKCFCGLGSTPDPAGELIALPRPSSLLPLYQTPSPLSACGLEFHDFLLDKLWISWWVPWAVEIAAKGFASKKRVEKHWLILLLFIIIISIRVSKLWVWIVLFGCHVTTCFNIIIIYLLSNHIKQ